MQRASNTFSLLQATAVVVTLAIILWSLGLPTFRFAEAAAITTYSDTLSTSEPSVDADHTIEFTVPTAVPNGGTVSIDLAAFNGTTTIVDTDITVASSTASYTVAGDCTGSEQVGVSFGANDNILTLTFCATDGGAIQSNGTTTVQIGTGANQLDNPTTGNYEIPISTSAGDSGETRVAIVDVVTVTASVDTLLNFSVGGVADAQTVHGTSTGTTTSATAIAFGQLSASTPITGAQDLTVSTNAANGFTVTVTADGQLTAGGSDIDGFSNGSYVTSPIAWAQPTAIVSDENTWGHWGIISDDIDLFPTTETWVSASTTAVGVMTYTGPVQATTTRVGYTVEISSLQEASENYQAILTYVATPVF